MHSRIFFLKNGEIVRNILLNCNLDKAVSIANKLNEYNFDTFICEE